MRNFFRGIIRASSFFQKEIFEILRQPRLITTLVLGPFLILFIFGLGYKAESRTLRAMYVVQPNSTLNAQDIQQYGESVGLPLINAGTTTDQADAIRQLSRGQVDIVIVEPKDPINTIKDNQQAVFTIYHREIDPTQVSYVDYLAWLYVGEINKQLLRSFAVKGQSEAADLQTNLMQAHQNASAARDAIQAGDEVLAQQKEQDLTNNADTISMAVGASLGLLNSLQQQPQGSGVDTSLVENTLNELRQNTNQLAGNTLSKDDRLARINQIDKNITDLDSQLAEFQSLDPNIIVSPFRSETKGIANIQPSLVDFFAPAVLALLLQHLAVTFAALSVVRERNVGTMELFRVSPLSAAEALLGKYLSYMLFGGIIAAIISALLVYALHMPFLGSWVNFALVIAAVLFTSLGIGFIISIVSQTDSQAVQLSMLTLLASVFFSGFIMTLDMLWKPVRAISWMLPNTYGTLLLRDIALRGITPNWTLLGYLVIIGLVMMLISWRLMVRLIASSK